VTPAPSSFPPAESGAQPRPLLLIPFRPFRPEVMRVLAAPIQMPD